MKSLIKINEKNIKKYRIMSFSNLLGCCSSRLILKASKMTIIIKLSVYLSQTEANFQPHLTIKYLNPENLHCFVDRFEIIQSSFTDLWS